MLKNDAMDVLPSQYQILVQFVRDVGDDLDLLKKHPGSAEQQMQAQFVKELQAAFDDGHIAGMFRVLAVADNTVDMSVNDDLDDDNRAFQIGDAVQLKIGGPPMIVRDDTPVVLSMSAIRYDTKSPHVQVIWLDVHGCAQTDLFDVRLLKRYVDE